MAKPFALTLSDGRKLTDAGSLQEFIIDLHDKLPAINDPEFQEKKKRYNKFANFYNEHVADVWTIYK